MTDIQVSSVKMTVSPFASGILCLMMIWAVFACAPKNYTLYVQRLHCDRCVAINTTVCSGFCYSQDTNLRGQMGRWQPYQRGCTYQMLAYQTAVLPGCQLNVDSLYSYPAALSCHCARCDTASSDCIHKVKDITRANTSSCLANHTYDLQLHSHQPQTHLHTHLGSN